MVNRLCVMLNFYVDLLPYTTTQIYVSPHEDSSVDFLNGDAFPRRSSISEAYIVSAAIIPVYKP